MSTTLPLRIALGLGDQELEQRLRPALDADDELQVALTCLAADQVVQALESDAVDVIVLAWGLHRLGDPVLRQLERARLPVVLLAPESEPAAQLVQRITLLPPEIDPAALRSAIKMAARGERWRAPPRSRETTPAIDPPAVAPPGSLQVIAVAGGPGSPGRTTLAINLATALGAIVPTVLIDLDCASPCVAAYLDRDPSLNVCTLAHTVREEPSAWRRAIFQELQPLHPRSPHGLVLCGLPKRELRPSVTPAIVERLVQELARIYRYVIVDIGAELLGMDAPALVNRAVLSVAQHILLVTSCDLVGLWQSRIALTQLERSLSIERERVSLVANRHDPRYHHSITEIEWHLGTSVAQVIPHEYAAHQRAMAERQPVVLEQRSRAARATVQLAERIHQGTVKIPADKPEPAQASRSGSRVTLPAAVAGLIRWGSLT